jgi:hypothetical protein
MRMGVAESRTLGGASIPANSAFRRTARILALPHRRTSGSLPSLINVASAGHGCLALPRAPDMWSNLPNVTRDACGVFVQRFPKALIVRCPLTFPSFHHHPRRVVALAPIFSPCRSRLPFFLLVNARHNPVHTGTRTAIYHHDIFIFIIIDQRAVPKCCDARRRTLRAFPSGARRGRQCNGRDGTLRRRVRACR